MDRRQTPVGKARSVDVLFAGAEMKTPNQALQPTAQMAWTGLLELTIRSDGTVRDARVIQSNHQIRRTT